MAHVITVAQQKGGAGKTTLAVNLAVGFARAGKTVALMDTDPQGSAGRWFMTRLEALEAGARRAGRDAGDQFLHRLGLGGELRAAQAVAGA